MKAKKPVRFPRIREYIQETGMTVQEFIYELDEVVTINMYFMYQRGAVDPPYRFIRAVLDSTLMTFEEAFREGEHG